MKLMKSQMTIGKKIALLAATLVALTVLHGAVSLMSLRNMTVVVKSLASDAIPGLDSIATMTIKMMDYRIDCYQQIGSSTPQQMAEIERRQHAIRDSLAKEMVIYENTISQADDHVNFDQMKRQVEIYFQAWEKVLPVSRSGRNTQAYDKYASEAEPAFANLYQTMTKIQKWNSDWGKKTHTDGLTTGASDRFWEYVVLLGTILTSAVLSWFIIRGVNSALRQIAHELTNGGEQVAAAAAQIASTSQSLAQGSSQQAASLEEVSAAMEEMNAMTKRNAENSSEATAMMAETVSHVDVSNNALEDMMASMSAIKMSSEKVAKINKTIDEIAFQTNILALNAAVEAARAGEAGMGFAVVAEEVRNLAQRSAVAAKDTAALIEEAIANSNQGASKLERVATAIRAITDSASKVKGLVDEVNEASRQQTQGINQVATAVTQVSTVTQTAAASAEESAAAAEELSAQAQTVADLVRQLKRMVEDGGGAERGLPHTAGSGASARRQSSKPASHATSNKAKEDPFPMETSGNGSFRNF